MRTIDGKTTTRITITQEVGIEFQDKIPAIKAVREASHEEREGYLSLNVCKRVVDTLYAEGYQLVKITS